MKYADLLSFHIFVRIAIETIRVFGIHTLSFMKSLGKRLSRHFGDPKSTSFLIQTFQSLSSGVTLSLFAALLLQPIWTIDFLLLILLHLHLSVFIVTCTESDKLTTYSHCIT